MILTVDAVKESDVCVTMGCGDTFTSKRYLTGSWTTPPARASRLHIPSTTRSRRSCT
jgi:hypothetical protein